MTRTPPFHLHAFPDTAGFARRLARAAALPSAQVRVHRFPDGEALVRIAAPAGRHAFLVRSLHAPDAKLVETLLAADALRRAGARRVTLVAPYLPYMRQDRVFRAGEPLSQRVVGGWLAAAFDAVLTVEAHLHRVRRLSQVIADGSRSLSAAPAVAAWLGRARETCVVGPDVESAALVRTIAGAAGASWIVGRKRRLGDRRVGIRIPPLPKATARAVIVDDVASSGGTIAATARALRRRGVRTIDAVVAHAIFAPGAERRIRAAGVRRVVSCDTIPHPTNAIAVAPLVAAAIGRPS